MTSLESASISLSAPNEFWVRGKGDQRPTTPAPGIQTRCLLPTCDFRGRISILNAPDSKLIVFQHPLSSSSLTRSLRNQNYSFLVQQWAWVHFACPTPMSSPSTWTSSLLNWVRTLQPASIEGLSPLLADHMPPSCISLSMHRVLSIRRMRRNH